MKPVDVESCLLWIFDHLQIRSTTVLRDEDLFEAPSGEGELIDPFVWLQATEGVEQYGPYRMDPVDLHVYHHDRDAGRALADRVVDELTSQPWWTPVGLLDGMTLLDGPTRNPDRDPSVHEHVVRLAVETRPA